MPVFDKISLLSSGINASRKRKANDLFEEMRAADDALTKSTLSKALVRPDSFKMKPKKVDVAKQSKKQKLNEVMQLHV